MGTVSISLWPLRRRSCNGEPSASQTLSQATGTREASGVRPRRLRARRSLGSSFAVPERLAHLSLARAQVFCVAVLPDGRIVSGDQGGTLIVWAAGDGEGSRSRPMVLSTSAQ